MDAEHYDDIIIGGGKAGKTLAPALIAVGRKTALVERSLNMIGGGCINVACIPTKTMVASAEVAYTVRHSSADGDASSNTLHRFARWRIDSSHDDRRVKSIVITVVRHFPLVRY